MPEQLHGKRAACNPVIFEPMAMSILLTHQEKLEELGYKFNDVLWQEISAQAKAEKSYSE